MQTPGITLNKELFILAELPTANEPEIAFDCINSQKSREQTRGPSDQCQEPPECNLAILSIYQ
ncbi:hypothetical protein BWD42_21515 [Sphingobacterium sp. CZ-UAM]|nr:hypothetical protein BWD42_21515 [Sphingobacterium sp. CZ-UAM]